MKGTVSLLAVLVVVGSACSDGAAGTTTTRAAPPPGSSTAPPPTTTLPATTTPPSTSTTSSTSTTTTTLVTSPEVIAERCGDPLGVMADVDGDGRDDATYHGFYDGATRLGVCTAAGATDEIDGAGMAEILGAADLDGDGRAEVLFGGTSAGAAFRVVATWRNDRLAVVLDPDDTPFTLVDGFPMPVDGPRIAFGCLERDGLRHVAMASFAGGAAEPESGDVEWQRTWWRIESGRAALVAADEGIVAAPLTPAVVRSVVGEC